MSGQAQAELEGIVGRDGELARVADFLAGSQSGTLLVEGPPGVGKTTLWDAGVAIARRSVRVLASRPSSADSTLSFSGLTDLLEDVDVGSLAAVPEPQRQALEVALLRAVPGSEPLDTRAVGTGLLSTLRALAETTPLLVAIDDVQWLDTPSATALAFALRRLRDAPVSVLLAKRAATTAQLGQAPQRLGHREQAGREREGRRTARPRGAAGSRRPEGRGRPGRACRHGQRLDWLRLSREPGDASTRQAEPSSPTSRSPPRRTGSRS